MMLMKKIKKKKKEDVKNLLEVNRISMMNTATR